MARWKLEFRCILDDAEVPDILKKVCDGLHATCFQSMELRDGKFTITQPGVHLDETGFYGSVTQVQEWD